MPGADRGVDWRHELGGALLGRHNLPGIAVQVKDYSYSDTNGPYHLGFVIRCARWSSNGPDHLGL